MKKKLLLFATMLVPVGIIGVWLWRDRSEGTMQASAEHRATTPFKPISAAPASNDAVPSTPRLFKSKRYPPETTEEKAMWEWWNKISKLDPNFEWKMPITFYGLVVDQRDEPVSEATVDIQWSTAGGTDKRVLVSGADGRFELGGVHGKGINVSIRKDGYLPSRTSGGGFEYAEFFNDSFHVPERARPVVFRLQKLMGAEPCYVFPLNGRTTPDGLALWLNVENGKFETTGHLSFAVSLGDKKTRMGQEYTIVVQARDGTGFVPTSEEFAFRAPEGGYENALTVHQAADDPNYQLRKNIKLYAKLADGRYAFVGVEVTLIPGGDVLFGGGVRYNQNWSRNLEFDPRKWINR